MIPRVLAATLVSLVLLVQAPALQADHLSLTANPSAVSLAPGDATTVDVSVSGGGSEIICLGASGEGGVSAALGFGPCGGGSFGGPLEISAGPSAAPGSYTVAVSAQVGETVHASAGVTVTVEAPATSTPTATPSATPTASATAPPAPPTAQPPPPPVATSAPIASPEATADPERVEFAAVSALTSATPASSGLFLELPGSYENCLGQSEICQPAGEPLVLAPASGVILAWIVAATSESGEGVLTVGEGPFAGLELTLFAPEGEQIGQEFPMAGSAPGQSLSATFLLPLIAEDGTIAVIPASLRESADGFSLTAIQSPEPIDVALLPLVLTNAAVQGGAEPGAGFATATHVQSSDVNDLEPVMALIPSSTNEIQGLGLYGALLVDGEGSEIVAPLLSGSGSDQATLSFLSELDGQPGLYTSLPSGLDLAPGEVIGVVTEGATPDAGDESAEVLAADDDGGSDYLGLTLGAVGAAAAVAGAAVFFVTRRAPAVETVPVADVAAAPLAIPVSVADDCDEILRRWKELQAAAEAAEKEEAEARSALERAESDAESKEDVAEDSASDKILLDNQLADLRAQVEQAEADVQKAAARMAEALKDLEKAREAGGGLARTYNVASHERRYRKLADKGKAANQKLQDLIKQRDELARRQEEATEDAAEAKQDAQTGATALAELRAEAQSKAEAAEKARDAANAYAARYRECIGNRIEGLRDQAKDGATQAEAAAKGASSAASAADAAAAAQASAEAAEKARVAAEGLKELEPKAEEAGLSDERAGAEREARSAAAQAGGAASRAGASARQKQKEEDAQRKREEALEAQRRRDEQRREEAVARQIRRCEARGPDARTRTSRRPETIMRFTVPYGAEPGSFQHAIGEALNAIDRSKASLGPIADGLVTLARGSTKDARDLWAIQKVTSTAYESTCCDGSGHEQQVGEPTVTYRLRKLESMTDKQMDLMDGLPEQFDDAIDMLDRIKGASLD